MPAFSRSGPPGVRANAVNTTSSAAAAASRSAGVAAGLLSTASVAAVAASRSARLTTGAVAPGCGLGWGAIWVFSCDHEWDKRGLVLWPRRCNRRGHAPERGLDLVFFIGGAVKDQLHRAFLGWVVRPVEPREGAAVGQVREDLRDERAAAGHGSSGGLSGRPGRSRQASPRPQAGAASTSTTRPA